MGLQRVRHNLLTEQQQMLLTPVILTLKKLCGSFPVLSQPFIMEAVSSFHLECSPYLVFTIYCLISKNDLSHGE